ncbi:MAG: methyltransferase domain-containing protein [Nitrospirae bacterium]|nr:methyltransferase domain-containing protein [Nitrospirota bacterium]
MTDNLRGTNYPEIDIDKIMERIRAEVSRRRGYAGGSAGISDTQDQKMDTAAIDTSMIKAIISSAEASADIARVPSMLRFRGMTRKLAVFVAGKISYLSGFITNKQRNYNVTTIHALKTLTDNLERFTAGLQDEIAALKSADAGAIKTIKELKDHLSQTKAAMGSGLAEQTESSAALMRDINEKAAKIEELVHAVSYLKYTITKQERELSIFLEEASKRLPEHFSVEEIRDLAGGKEHLLDALYVFFEDRFRGTRGDIKEGVKVYLPYIKAVNAGTYDSPLLDIGCGRGEWLELLKENGLEAKGVDINSVLVNECRGRNLEVIENDVIPYLRSLPDASLGALTGLHIIEHLPFKMLICLLDETVRVLKPGGIAIFETPNPENVLVGSCNFYLDPTHRKPLPSSMIKFMAEARGLSKVEILNLHPVSEAKRLSGSDVADRFNEYFYGPQDYAVIGYKKIEND